MEAGAKACHFLLCHRVDSSNHWGILLVRLMSRTIHNSCKSSRYGAIVCKYKKFSKYSVQLHNAHPNPSPLFKFLWTQWKREFEPSTMLIRYVFKMETIKKKPVVESSENYWHYHLGVLSSCKIDYTLGPQVLRTHKNV